jgi:DNA gyrase subunit B
MMRGEKKQVVSNFGDAMKWLLADVERGISKQRYKGFGEMNPSNNFGKRRWTRRSVACCVSRSTTPLPLTRFSRRLMGELVEPRRAFIENNALNARIDI